MKAEWEDTLVCKRTGCGHPMGWHRARSGEDPTLSSTEFRCIGYDCTVAGPPISNCNCPDYVE